MEIDMIELYGYLGSILVVVSMLMSSIVRLRIVNTVGSIVSGTYSLIIGSFPLALMNFSLIAINLYNLFKLLKSKQNYDLIEGTADEAFLKYFLDRYQEDIKMHFPGFNMQEKWFDKAYMICCEGTPAGLLLGTEKADGVMEIAIDYATPAYRDCSVGTYLYEKLPQKGIHKLVYSQPEAESFVSYLEKMGFEKEQGAYTKKL